MPQYLIDTSAFPFTAAEIRAAMGLETDQFDGLIECTIDLICAGAPVPLRREVWKVEPEKIDQLGVPVKVGPVHLFRDRWYRDVTYDPDLSLLGIAKSKIISMLRQHDDIDMALLNQARRKVADASRHSGEAA